jgi:hypothetical protein
MDKKVRNSFEQRNGRSLETYDPRIDHYKFYNADEFFAGGATATFVSTFKLFQRITHEIPLLFFISSSLRF